MIMSTQGRLIWEGDLFSSVQEGGYAEHCLPLNEEIADETLEQLIIAHFVPQIKRTASGLYDGHIGRMRITVERLD